MARPLETQEGAGHLESELRSVVRTVGIMAVSFGVTGAVRALNRLRQQHVPMHYQAGGWLELDLTDQPEQLAVDSEAA